MKPEDLKLLRQYEPILVFSRGEMFFPIDVSAYVEECSLWQQSPNGESQQLLAEDQVDLNTLSSLPTPTTGTIQFLKFIEPLNIAQLATYHLKEGLSRKPEEETFKPGFGRLARVGYISRVIAALFSLSLITRGRVPGDTAAAAIQLNKQILSAGEPYRYHGRVLRQDHWIILQYWFFYPFNNWRSGFSGVNDHEADWEMVCVYLSENQNSPPTPEWVSYASHDFSGDDLRRRWDDPQLHKQETHPIVYIGAGSHASYFLPGEYMTELELAFLSPAVRLYKFLKKQWQRLLKLTELEEELGGSATGFNFFRVPFIDFARGDGLKIGPGQEQAWAEPHSLSPLPAWAKNYRGLWGLYARDPISGENAPAGPVYNRDGSIRKSWYDPLGWAGLDKILPPQQAILHSRQHALHLRARIQEINRQIETKSAELHALGLEMQASQEHFHLQDLHQQRREQTEALSTELDALRAEAAQTQSMVEALEERADRLKAGHRSLPQSHLSRPHLPTSPETMRLSRFAEVWSAISIGLALIGLMVGVLFARQHIMVILGIIVGLFAFVEASSRRRLPNLIRGVTIGLSITSALILLFEFFWQIIVITILIAGIYIIWENVRELVS